MECFQKQMYENRNIKRICTLTSFFSWTIQCQPDGTVHASQAQPIDALILKSELFNASPRRTPFPAKQFLDEKCTAKPLDHDGITRFQSLLGELTYLAD